MPGLSTYAANALLDRAFGGAAFSRPATVYLEPYTVLPDNTGANGTVPSGNGYSGRVAVTNNTTSFPAASSGAKSNGALVLGSCSGGTWGTLVGVGIWDASSSGNLLGLFAFADPLVTVSGKRVKLRAGQLSVSLTGAWDAALANALLDHLLGGPDYTPVATWYAGLLTAGAELSGNGYARVALANNSTNFPAASAGAKANGAGIEFGPATGGSWSAATRLGFYTASSGGTVQSVGALASSVTVATGQTSTVDTGEADIAIVPTTVELFPLEIHVGGRYTVGANGQPFLIRGDAAYSLIAQLSGSALTQYLDAMVARGVNTLLVNLFEHKFSDDAPNNALGVAPFNTPEDLRTLNSSYFAHVRTVLDACVARDLCVFLEICYLGFEGGDEGFYSAFNARTSGELEDLAEAIMAELAAYPNLVIVIGGDFTPPSLTKVNAFAVAAKAAGAYPYLFTFHPSPSSSSRAAGVGSWLDLNWVYVFDEQGEPSEDDTVPGFIHAYNLSPTMAWFNAEPRYEGFASSVQWIREQVYGAVLGGGCGSIPGAEPRWHFDAPTGFITTGWVASLTSEMTLDYDHVATFLAGRRWYDLIPSVGSGLVTAGRGTAETDGYVTAAITADGRLACIYCPDTDQITVDMSDFSGTVAGTWCNVRTGATTTVTSSPFANSGTRNFTPPSADMLLILEV